MKYYLIGIKGAGLSSLALILHDMGYKVVGYDDEIKPQFTEIKLKEVGIPIYNKENEELDQYCVVVYSSAIRKDHPQRQKAEQLQVKMYEYHEMLGHLTEKFHSITIAGCHGKTTTTSLMATVLKSTIGCNYLIGDGSGFANKENQWFLLEACEYRRHFFSYTPTYAIITNIDMDHVDYFQSIDDLMDAYKTYANKAEKMVIACGDDPYTHALDIKKPIFFYGLDDDNDIIAKDVVYTKDGIKFDVFVEDNYYGHFDLPFYGKHMLLNSLAVIGLCYYERMDAKEVLKQMKQFQGAKRRFSETMIGENVIIDDYAHHPTEIRSVIKAVRQKYPDKTVVAIFQPHTYSRTKEFAHDEAEALNLADACFVLDIFAARERQEDFEGVSSKLILDQLKNGASIKMDDVTPLFHYKDAVYVFMSPKEIAFLKDQLMLSLNEMLS